MSPTSEMFDDFVDIKPANGAHPFPIPGHHGKDKKPESFYADWLNHSSASQCIPIVFGAEALRQLYPKHSLILTEDWSLDILSFPNAQVVPIDDSPLVTNLRFAPLARNTGVPGLLVDQVEFGSFKVTWQQYEFIVHQVIYPVNYGSRRETFILHDGPEAVPRLFLMTVGAYANDLHEEIWVFNQGFWNKEHNIWKDIQKAHWSDVILKDEFKKVLQKDVYGFFDSEQIYRDLAIPWKRGIIMYGPPGNGKTISLKVIMKTCSDKGFLPLYVKSFQSWMGEEAAMATVFSKARQLSPCVIVLEDLDSLINDSNRSFFLNQLDGLEGNDGLLIIGTTNHFDRLDPGLSTRPSRFDRKYLFDDPDAEERKLYAKYWQNKLKSNKDVEFSDQLLDDFVSWTDRFSFAYLKEAFVSSLVVLAGYEGEKPTFEKVLKGQVASLRKQLDRTGEKGSPSTSRSGVQRPHSSAQAQNDHDYRAMMDSLSEFIDKTDFGGVGPSNRIYRSAPGSMASHPAPGSAAMSESQRRIRELLDSLSETIQTASQPQQTERIFTSNPGASRQPFGRPAAAQEDPLDIFQKFSKDISRELGNMAAEGRRLYGSPVSDSRGVNVGQQGAGTWVPPAAGGARMPGAGSVHPAFDFA